MTEEQITQQVVATLEVAGDATVSVASVDQDAAAEAARVHSEAKWHIGIFVRTIEAALTEIPAEFKAEFEALKAKL